MVAGFYPRPVRATATIAAVMLAMCSCGAVQAGWLTIKNDTSETIVVQESVAVNGQVKRGKPTNLLPGETLREFLAGPSVKRIEVFNSKGPNQAAWSGDLNCQHERQIFKVSINAGQLSVDPIPLSTR